MLGDNREKGGIAMKFEVAYFRPTTFSDPTRQQAEEIYQRYVSGSVPAEQEYRTFQDYIFRFLVGLEQPPEHSGAHSHGGWHRQLLQFQPEQRHESGERAA